MLALPIYLCAYPHYYDFMQVVSLNLDGTVEMVDGAGQVINSEIKGNYRLETTKKGDRFKIHFSGLSEYDPYTRDKLDDLPDNIFHVKKESGIFAFYQEVVWKIDDPEQHPCLLYKTRYIFDKNPFDCCDDNRNSNLYHISENKDFTESDCFYYATQNRQELTFSQLQKLGINIGLNPTN